MARRLRLRNHFTVLAWGMRLFPQHLRLSIRSPASYVLGSRTHVWDEVIHNYFKSTIFLQSQIHSQSIFYAQHYNYVSLTYYWSFSLFSSLHYSLRCAHILPSTLTKQMRLSLLPNPVDLTHYSWSPSSKPDPSQTLRP